MGDGHITRSLPQAEKHLMLLDLIAKHQSLDVRQNIVYGETRQRSAQYQSLLGRSMV